MMLKRAPYTMPEINMTPMIDCVFLLLIFFLVATQIKQSEAAVSVRLPQSTQELLKKIEETPAPLNINILPKAAGSKPYVILNRRLSNTELQEVLRMQAKMQHEAGGELATVRIRADREATLEQLQTVLKACQNEKILHVYIAAEKVAKIG